MEMWLPITDWNGHFRGTSPNGLGGVINYNAMAVGLSDGFAQLGNIVLHIVQHGHQFVAPHAVGDLGCDHRFFRAGAMLV